jgi:hypothetical protein
MPEFSELELDVGATSLGIGAIFGRELPIGRKPRPSLISTPVFERERQRELLAPRFISLALFLPRFG